MIMSSGNGASAHGVRQVAWFDCPGGGQVVVDGARRLHRPHEGARTAPRSST